MRCKGTPVYTQRSVAFPTLSRRTYEVDNLGVSFAANEDGGGGTHGEFHWTFHRFKTQNGEADAVSLEVFGDSLAAFNDERIQRVLAKWYLSREENQDATEPEVFIRWLEEEGIGPSPYHLEGLNALPAPARREVLP